MSLEKTFFFPRSAHNWQNLQENLKYINMWFLIIIFPFQKEDDICRTFFWIALDYLGEPSIKKENKSWDIVYFDFDFSCKSFVD